MSLNRQRSALDPNTEWTSSLSLGGLTNYWTGAVPRFAPEDFTEGSGIDERFEWPIRYEDLAPFYDLVEEDFRITRGGSLPNIPEGRAAYRHEAPADWQTIIAKAAARGDFLAPIPIAKGSRWMVALRPREFTAYHCVIRKFERAPNFRIQSGARVLRVNYSAERGRAESVTFADAATGDVKTLRGRAIVVAAGALDSTEILLRSQSDAFPAGLGNDSGVLGRYLHDHPREWWPVQLDRPMTPLYHSLYLSREASETSKPLLAASQMIGMSSGKDRLYSLVNRRIPRLGVQVFGTMIPSPDAGVSLADGTSPDDPASALHIAITFDDDAVSTLHRARERFVEVFAATGNKAQIGPFHELAPGSSYHLGGTVRMHDCRDFGVLDAWNRVHDVPNVVVCDASCFTTGPEKNPTLTSMAIAARAARKLAADVA